MLASGANGLLKMVCPTNALSGMFIRCRGPAGHELEWSSIFLQTQGYSLYQRLTEAAMAQEMLADQTAIASFTSCQRNVRIHNELDETNKILDPARISALYFITTWLFGAKPGAPIRMLRMFITVSSL